METKTKKKKKEFDAIKTMREIRDAISLEIMNMTYSEERAYIDKLLANGGYSDQTDPSFPL
jgi:hypothetical protein